MRDRPEDLVAGIATREDMARFLDALSADAIERGSEWESRNEDDVATLSVTDLSGRSREHASFQAPERLDAFAFDGSRLAFAHTRYRPDQGDADDALPSICVGERILVQAAASIIEVHPVTNPGRIPAPSLPLAKPYRSPAAERPECPYRD